MSSPTAQNREQKRAYRRPALRVYGTVGELTGTVDVGGPKDGGGHPKDNMTRPIRAKGPK